MFRRRRLVDTQSSIIIILFRRRRPVDTQSSIIIIVMLRRRRLVDTQSSVIIIVMFRRRIMKIKKKKTSGYAIFCSEQRRKYTGEQPDLQFSDIR